MRQNPLIAITITSSYFLLFYLGNALADGSTFPASFPAFILAQNIGVMTSDFTVCAGYRLTFSLCSGANGVSPGCTGNTLLALYYGGNGGNYIKSNNDGAAASCGTCSSIASYSFPTGACQSYRLQQICFPTSATACSGTLQVVVEGECSPIYQEGGGER